jgi:ATP-binding cassette subfamily C protein
MSDETRTATGPLGDDGQPAGWPGVIGEEWTVGANRPVELADDTAWYVLEGTLDLFLQQLTAGGYGRRHLLMTAHVGTLAWTGGDVPVPAGWRLLAVGHPGTKLLRANGSQLRDVADETMAERVDRFVAAATTAIDEDGGGKSEQRDRPSVGERLDRARDRFEQAIQAAIRLSATNEAAEDERLETRPEREQHLLDRAISNLVEVVERGERLGTADDDDQLAQLDLALARIGRQLGVEFPTHIGLEQGGSDPVAARMSAAGCRSRVVTLRTGWWRNPGMVLLAFRSNGGRPVALVPRQSRYLLFDPSTGTTSRIDEQVASTVASQAYAVYRPLPPDVASAGSLFRAVRPLVGLDLRLLLGLGAVAGLVTLITPMVTSIVYNSVLPDGDRSLLLDVAVLLIAATVTWGLVTLSKNLAVVRLSGQLDAYVDPGLMDRLLQLPSEFFRRYDSGDLATRAGGLQIIRQQLSGTVITSFVTLLFASFNVALLFVYSIVLGAVSLGVLALVLVIVVVLNVRSVRHQHKAYDHGGEVAADLYQILQGIHKMRAAGAESRLMARWARGFRRQQRETYAAGRVQAWIFALISALPTGLAFTLYAVTAGALDDKITGGDFLAVMTALGQFTAALAVTALTIGPLLTVIPLWQRLLPILREPVEEMGTGDPGSLSGRVSIRDVSFAYGRDSPPALRGVSFDVRPGEFVAITGASGSGKSTLLRLLLGLDHPDSGTILFDGKDLDLLDARAVRSQIGVVMQDARPLPGEILSTILGEGSSDEGEAWAAAEGARLADDIRHMPMGMHTIIGEGGLTFSGGQVQRMMIARAFARRPKLLLFDEATSALDDRDQAIVSEHIEQMDTTRIVIAHRLSTIRHADTIYVLDRGRLAQAGTFDEMMAVEGPFRRLAARQLL